MKKTRFISFALALFVTLTMLCACAGTSTEGNKKCVLSVDCSAVAEKMDEAIAPEDGKFILAPTEIGFSEGETLDKVLIAAFRKMKLHFEADDGYFTAIGNLYTGDFGELSGWLYYVNGTIPEIGTKEYTVCDGDIIEFVYFDDFNKAFED